MRRPGSVFSRVYSILLSTIAVVALLALAGFALQAKARGVYGPRITVFVRGMDGREICSSQDEALLAEARDMADGYEAGFGRQDGAPYIALRNAGNFFLVYGSSFVTARRVVAAAIGLGLILVGIAVASYAAMRSVLAPLKRLGRGVRALRGGDYGVKVEAGGSREFEDLASSFNRLADRIRYQLEMKEHLLLDVSHELRSPLTRLAVGLEFVSDENLRRDMREDLLEMERKISQLLSASRLGTPYGTPSLARIELGFFLSAIVAKFDGSVPSIRFDGTRGAAPFVEADPDMLETVVRNVLENAIRYSLPNGLPIELGCRRANGSIEIRVRDWGRGIRAGNEIKVFEPFFRERSENQGAKQGFGIGLYLCKRIIDAHGGSISISNATGGGAETVVKLPEAAPPSRS